MILAGGAIAGDPQCAGDLLPATGLVTSSEDYYPTVAINALMRNLRDPAMSSHHPQVIRSLFYIFQALHLASVPYLPKACKTSLPPPTISSTLVVSCAQHLAHRVASWSINFINHCFWLTRVTHVIMLHVRGGLFWDSCWSRSSVVESAWDTQGCYLHAHALPEMSC